MRECTKTYYSVPVFMTSCGTLTTAPVADIAVREPYCDVTKKLTTPNWCNTTVSYLSYSYPTLSTDILLALSQFGWLSAHCHIIRSYRLQHKCPPTRFPASCYLQLPGCEFDKSSPCSGFQLPCSGFQWLGLLRVKDSGLLGLWRSVLVLRCL